MAANDAQYMHALKAHLVRHGLATTPDEISDENLEQLITDFQSSKSLLADGIVGPVTLWALQYDFAIADKKLKLVSVKADKPPKNSGYDGFDKLKLREDAAAAFERLAANVRAAGGIVTTSGGLRPISAKPDANQSALSFHYPGLAFDLSVSTGGWNVEKDPFVLEWSDQDKRWIVWTRVEKGDEQTLNAIEHSGSWKDVKVSHKPAAGKFINFTELAAAEGFSPIGPRSNYRREHNKHYMSSEWWHFQYEASLAPGFSQFGIELLRIEGYDSFWSGMKNSGPWAYHKHVFKQNWN